MKIAILCGTGLDVFQQKVLQPIMDDPTIKIVGALVDCRPRPSLKKRFLKNLKRGRGGYMIVMLFKSRMAKKKPSIDVPAFFSSHSISCIETQEPYSEEVANKLKSLLPEALVMLSGFGIVKEPLLSLAPQGILSYHHGNMRKYRGQPVGFWELYHGEKEMGITVQRLSAGLDRGTPIVEMTIPIEKGDNVATLRGRALDSSTGMMHKALQLVQQPDYKPMDIDHYGPVFTIPNLRQYLTLQIKLLFRK
jgi:folate-dependent phosphoribosylglycinamide formyltransferase PurN